MPAASPTRAAPSARSATPQPQPTPQPGPTAAPKGAAGGSSVAGGNPPSSSSAPLLPPPPPPPPPPQPPPPAWVLAVQWVARPLPAFAAFLLLQCALFVRPGLLGGGNVCPPDDSALQHVASSALLLHVQLYAGGVAAGTALLAASVAWSKKWSSAPRHQLTGAPLASAFALTCAAIYWSAFANNAAGFRCLPGVFGVHLGRPSLFCYLLCTAPLHVEESLATLTDADAADTAAIVLADALLILAVLLSFVLPQGTVAWALACAVVLALSFVVTLAMQRWVSAVVARHADAASQRAAALARASVAAYVVYLGWLVLGYALPPAVESLAWPVIDVGIKASYWALLLTSGWALEDTALEVELIASQQQLVLAEQLALARRRFVQFVVHELRQPSNTLLLGVESLQEACGDEATETGQRLPPEEQETLRIMQVAAGALLSSIQEFLLLEQAGQAGFPVVVVACDVRALVQGTVSIFSLTASRRGVKLQVAVEAAVPQAIPSDSVRIHTVLMNLVSNAVKASPDRGVVDVAVSLVTRRSGCPTVLLLDADDGDDAGGDGRGNLAPYVRIAVTDDGCGISRDEAEHLFKPFAQLTSTAAGGSGLGLLLCAQLAATLGGYIRLRCRPPPIGQVHGRGGSRRRRGAEFAFEVPVAGPPQVPVSASAAASVPWPRHQVPPAQPQAGPVRRQR